ncbi:MAG: bifunctional diaminohydroxyphosphoribosylaminopyrimidine deaminase/5-amino-6-(5-phosphoribosylamino)uracil reductase RibD [Bdellovibrionota bacterium]
MPFFIFAPYIGTEYLRTMALDDLALMTLALGAAERGTRSVRPNPRVGCVFELQDGTLIEGHHAICGGAHAERAALEKIHKSNLNPKGARVAVTLEPCSHKGKTPPCVDALIEAGVKEVLVPFLDPNPLVSGRGIARLEAAGISVKQGVAASKCFALNREWLWSKKLGRPFVTLKIATSKNAIAVADDRRWITSPAARQHAMSLRARVDLLLSSGETVRVDDPALTVRDELGNVAVDQPQVWIFSQKQDLGSSKKILSHPQWKWHHSVDLRASLESMTSQGFFDVMLECGPTLSKAFLDSSLVDELWHYQSDDELSGMSFDMKELSNFELVERVRIDEKNNLYKYTHKKRNEENFFKN